VARDVRLAGKDREARGVTLPEKAELRALMENAPARWRPFLVTAIFTGLRASELRGLTWADLDLDGGQLHVRQRADIWGHMGPPKSKAGRRSVPLAPAVINALREWRRACPKGDADLVFPNDRGRPLNHANFVKRVFGPLQLDSGIVDAEGRPKYGIHSLRHAAASLFIEQGWTAKKVQAVLGHASIQMTFDQYGHLFRDDESDREAMRRVEAALLAG
jgi:integrase